MAVPSDYTIVGTVLAIAVAILLLSGLALYVAFRVRETLRDEKGGSARLVKVSFLIGLLFLSGGVFYFFASGFNAGASPPSSSALTTTSGSSSFLSSATSLTSSSSTPTSSSTSITSTTTTPSTSVTSTASTSSSTSTSSATTSSSAQAVSMPAPSCPSRVTAGGTFTCYIYLYNQGSTTFSSATIVSSGDLTKFTFLGCTESVNGGPATQVSISGNTIAVGNIAPGTTVLTLTVQAPSQSGQYSKDILTLNAPGLSQPISVTFSIQVTA